MSDQLPASGRTIALTCTAGAIGGGELLEAETEEAAHEEDTVAESTMPLRKSLDGLP